MNRVLSLLLLVPFLITQVLTVTPGWARGGPFDDMLSRSLSALAGTYGVALTGDSNTWSIPAADGTTQSNPNSNVTGVLALTLPPVGIATGRVLLFNRGLMYLGTAQGLLDPRTGNLKLLSQLSHYFVRITTDGATQGNSAVVDSIYSGQIDLHLSVDYFTGLIAAEGQARFSEYNPLIGKVTQKTSADTSTSTTASNDSTTGPNDTKSVSTSNTSIKYEEDGSITTTTTSTTSNGGLTSSTSSSETGSKTGTEVSNFHDTTKQGKSDFLDLKLTASGVRQSTATPNIGAFVAPTVATSFQVEAPAGVATGQ